MSGKQVCTLEELDKILARLRIVKFLDKIMSDDHNDLVYAVRCLRNLFVDVVMPEAEVLAEDVLLADGTVQTLVVTEGLGLYYGLVSLDKLEAGDKVKIETFVWAVETGESRRFASVTYEGVQPDPLIVWTPILCRYGFKVTLQQVAGVYKTFEYGFYRRR